METILKVCWLALAAIHAAPAAVLFRPALVERLYGVAADGPAAVLLAHRGALFLAVLAAAFLAVVAPEARRAASLVVAISVLGFLYAYWNAGLPGGALRVIAATDAAALLPLFIVASAAWRR
jgi:hypothetical protein